MKGLILALMIALAAVSPGVMNTGHYVAQTVVAAQQSEQSKLDQQLHEMYEGAWERAARYTDLKPGEMPKFPEEKVHWLMRRELQSIDQDMQIGPWHTDIYKDGTARVLAWYKAERGVKIENGVSVPINPRIEMLVTEAEIMNNRYAVEGVLVHEMIHYIHHMRVMNLKGWETIWPGDGHNYMAFLKYVKGYDFPANR
jgi:hypothetical protein